VPPHRVDIDRLPDLYEEVIRHVGYGAVPSQLPVLPTTPGHRNPNWELIDRARDAAVAAGLAEVMTWSFIDPETDELVGSHSLCPGDPLVLDNPLATTQGVMRRSLLPGLLAAAQTNLNQGERAVAVFEQGRVFWLTDAGPEESERLALALVGPRRDGDRSVEFADLKGVVESVTDALALPEIHWRRGGGPWLDEDRGAVLEAAEGRVVGCAGAIADVALERWGIRSPVYAAELDLSIAPHRLPRPEFVELPRFPAVTADMTVEHATDLSYAELLAAVRELAGDLVEDVDFHVQFAGEGLPPGRIRTTLRLTYRAADRSLTQNEVNQQQDQLREALGHRLGVGFA